MKIELYGSPTCVPCKSLKPWLVAECTDRGIDYEYIDCEKNPQRAMMMGVQGFPTVIAFNDSAAHEVYDSYGPPQCTRINLRKVLDANVN